ALAWKGLNQSLCNAVICNSGAGSIDAACKRRFRDNSSIPNRHNKLIFADNAIPIFDQEDQEIEHLWFQTDQRLAAPKLTLLAVESKVGKCEHHEPSRYSNSYNTSTVALIPI